MPQTPQWKWVRKGLYMRDDGAAVQANPDGNGWIASDQHGGVHGRDRQEGSDKPWKDAKAACLFLDTIMDA